MRPVGARVVSLPAVAAAAIPSRAVAGAAVTARGSGEAGPPLHFGGRGGGPSRASVPPSAGPAAGARVASATLGQACPPECWRAQCAFKDSMVR